MAQSHPGIAPSYSTTGRAAAGPTAATESTNLVARFPCTARDTGALLRPGTSPAMGFTPARTTLLDSVGDGVIARLEIPQNFMVYIFSLPHQLSQRRMNEILDLLNQWAEWDILTSLASYRSVVEKLFGVLSELPHSLGTSHAMAKVIFEKLSQDVSAIHEQMIGILQDSENYKTFLACSGPLAQELLDLLQDLLDSFPESAARPLLSKALLRLSRASGLHPACFALSGLHRVGQQIAAGAFGDIWKGLVRGQSVSVKIMRIFRDADVKVALKEFGREALIWRQLSHPNLLPFFGLYYLENRLCLVSPWMANGHVLEFLENTSPGTDRLSLILDIAMGLEYLHSEHVVHGDLKGMNILVTPSHRACLADFGLSSIADAMTLRFTHSTSASARGGTARYQAPELIATDNPIHFESDVYAFACVCYEIITGKAPFFEIPRDVTVSIRVLDGLRPSRPDTVPHDALWALLQDCWEAAPTKRPDAKRVVQRLVSPQIGAKTTQSTTDWDEAFSSKVRRSLQDWPLLPSVSGVERRVFGDEAVEACSECSPRPVEEPIVPETHGATAPRPSSASRRSPRLSSPRGHSSPSPRKARWHPSPILSPVTEYDFVTEERTPSPPARAGSYRRLTLPLSCLTADHYVPITSGGRPPQMCEVFVSTHDLAVYHGASRDLPPLPPLGSPQRETLPQTTSPEDFRSQSSRDFRSPSPRAFDSSIVEDYLNMLAQTPQEEGAATNTPTAPNMRATYDLLATPDEFPDLGSDFGSPLFGTLEPYLTSPLDPQDDDFATPPDDTPWSAFLATPPLPAADLDVGGYEYGGMSLFGGISASKYEMPHRYATSPEPPASGGSTAASSLFRTPRYGNSSDSKGWMLVRGEEEAVKRPLEDTADPSNAKRKRLSV